MATTNNTATIFSVNEARLQKGVTSTAIYKAIAEGRLQALTIAGHWAIQSAALAKYEPAQRGHRPGSKGRGGRPVGQPLSQEHKDKISAAQKARMAKGKNGI